MSIEYDIYLEKHKANVKKGLDWILENIPNILENNYNFCNVEFNHDQSKSEPDEYDAYDAYFYGGNRSYEVVDNFKLAWLKHIHRNPHHWQYWVLINDDPDEGMVILDMPDNYIIEMICDWWAFSWAKGDLYEIFNWYDKHKDYMKLSHKTRDRVEYILNIMKAKLTELKGE